MLIFIFKIILNAFFLLYFQLNTELILLVLRDFHTDYKQTFY